MKLKEIQNIVKKTLSEKRYYHSKCVMDMCKKLAKIYGVDIEEAKKVGIAHDIAKEMNLEEQQKYIKENNIYIDDIEKQTPKLLHAKIGADIALKEFGFNKEMVEAIRCHTTAKENMDMLSKILYISDWIGLDRDFEDVKYIRKLVNKNIDEALVYALDKTIKEKEEKNELIHRR